MILPNWCDVREKVDAGVDLNPLERFIYNNEPSSAGNMDQGFREELLAAIEFVKEEGL